MGDPEELRIAIVTWIERTYHRRRGRHFNKFIPVGYGLVMNTTAAQAA